MSALSSGENCPLPAAEVTITVEGGVGVDVSALLLTATDRVRSDADFIFFNQPVGPGVTYRNGAGGPDVIHINTAAVPADITTIAVTASLDGSGPATFAEVGSLTATAHSSNAIPIVFQVVGITSEAAIVCVEIYRRGGGWKLRALGQGYDDGLAGIARAYGVSVDNDPEPAAAPPTTSSTAPPPTAGPAYAPPPDHSPNAAPRTPGPQSPYRSSVTSAPTGPASMKSELFAPTYAETNAPGMQKQGSKMLKVAMNGEIMARSGAMVAYQGEMRFQALGAGGIGRAIKQRLSGEGVPLMKITGRGDLFLANAAADVHIIDLDGSDGLTINGANVLAFEPSLSYQIARVSGAAMASSAGLFNCVFTGRGRIAITTKGTPVVLNVDQPTYADPQAAVAWSSSLHTGVQTNDSFNLGTLMGRSTGERFTLSFAGQGFVIVQPCEQPPGGLIGGSGSGGQAGSGMFG